MTSERVAEIENLIRKHVRTGMRDGELMFGGVYDAAYHIADLYRLYPLTAGVPVEPLDTPRPPASTGALAAEIAAYKAMLPNIRAEHGSCWAVVTGGELVKTFGEFGEAAMFVGANYPSGQPVLIRHTDEKPMFAPYIGVPLAPEWQPIETAPRDGTYIIIARDTGPPWGWVRGVGFWADFRELQGIEGWIPTSPASEIPGVLGLAHPTHWTPFPPPPTPEAGVFREEGKDA